MFYTVQQVAKILNVSRHFIYQLIHAGDLRAHRFGEKKFMVHESDLEEFLNHSRVPVPNID